MTIRCSSPFSALGQSGFLAALLAAAVNTCAHVAVRVEGADAPYVSSLAQDDTALFAGTWGDGVLRSMDGGKTWRRMNNGLTRLYVYTVILNGGELYAGTGGGGVFASFDYGESWSRMSEGLPDRHVFSLTTANGALIAGTWQQGVFRTRGWAEEWAQVQGPVSRQVVYCLISRGDTVVAGTSANGVFRSTDAGATWDNIGLWGKSITSLAFRGAHLLAGTWNHGLFRFSGVDTVWTGMGLPSEPIQALECQGPLLHVLMLGNGIYRSEGDGESLAPYAVTPCEGTSLAFHKGTLYTGTWGCGLFSFLDADPKTQSRQDPMASAPGRPTPIVSPHLPSLQAAQLTACSLTPGEAVSSGPSLSARPSKRWRTLSFSYAIPFTMHAMVCVFDRNGRHVRSVARGVTPAGRYTFSIDTDDLSKGLYIVTLCTSTRQCSMKVVSPD